MPILPLDHPMPMVAVTNIMLRPELDPDGIPKAASHTAEATRDLIRPYLADGWSVQDSAMMNLIAAPSATHDDEELAKYWQDGIAMGVTYMVFFTLMQQRSELASWNSAMKLVGHIRNDTDLPGSHGYLSKVKTRYASMAHLWAARLVQNRFENIDERLYSISTAFDFFLMDAERLRQIGLKFIQNPAPAISSRYSLPGGIINSVSSDHEKALPVEAGQVHLPADAAWLSEAQRRRS